MTIPELGDPVTFYQRNFQRQWWTSVIQSYAQLKLILKGEGLHSHHLIPKSLFLHGPKRAHDLIDYVPSVPFTEAEHLKTLHPALNELLRREGFWERDLSADKLKAAIDLTAAFYERHGLRHFAAAIRGFRREACDKIF